MDKELDDTIRKLIKEYIDKNLRIYIYSDIDDGIQYIKVELKLDGEMLDYDTASIFIR